MLEWVQKNKDIMSIGLGKEPARVDPMEIEMNTELWHLSQNRQAARKHGPEKEAAIRKFVQKGLEAEIIETATKAQAYSQVHVVPKPNSIEGQKQWRVVQDMRNHNKASKVSETFPLLNIKGAIQLIGDQKPKYFAKIDCKDGYHMMPLGSASRVFTAFICFMGIFQYKRVPMGQKGAASYFQRTMNQIFSGFVFTWMLIYLDDLIIWGNNLPELLQRLDLVAGKFREYYTILKQIPKNYKLDCKKLSGWVTFLIKTGFIFIKISCKRSMILSDRKIARKCLHF